MMMGAVDTEYTRRVRTPAEAWSFVMTHLDTGELLNVEIKAQDWRAEDESDWIDTLRVSVLVRTVDKEST